MARMCIYRDLFLRRASGMRCMQKVRENNQRPFTFYFWSSEDVRVFINLLSEDVRVKGVYFIFVGGWKL